MVYDVIGYFYCSIMDNFEWVFGYDKKFGLYNADHVTQKRTLRKGAKNFEKIAKKHVT